jgi:hypothetical protein
MKRPDQMSDEEFDVAVYKLGSAAAVVKGDERLMYMAELLPMIRRMHRDGDKEQIARIREYARDHRGEDIRPYMCHIMGWDNS